ncbi:hypothetical protein BBOV_III001690 [Babesia bovis T2Bo]|uniref:Uncharacterized protein n=1 Tax=Babesia bovis TaxID=5865 RepID=A7AMF2_BABBO|nr:hypothetical protein BBOV_III001690 [Babesia bovis T2Bo]EDO07736.1 hypothetical protein BBOV_III001690 [Babesia bovis T2Bo]|eukprot:XP_001611304.1 hypothetical protein [Babesia bovis T2Bo]
MVYRISFFVTLLSSLTHLGRCTSTHRNNSALTPYVAHNDANEVSNGGTVILDNSNDAARLPFVEVYGGRAFHYENPKDFISNDLAERQKELQNLPAYETDAYETMRNF